MLPADFFDPVLIESISALAALRAVVLERTTKCMPKWQFRITDDITIQIQPKPAIKKLRPYGYPGGFECEAVEDPGDDLGTRSMRFFLFLNPDGTWSLKMTRIGYRRSDTEDEKRPRAVERRDRMIWLSPRVFATLRPEMMLSGGCLVCGKKLTDPISQARWIGPECNQSATALNPFLIRLQEAAE